MPNTVLVKLEAKGQALAVTQAPAIMASDVLAFLRFDVTLSEEWEGFEDYALLLKNGQTCCACELVDGQACAEGQAIAEAGSLEVAIMARSGHERLTTERVIITLHDSGL